MIREERNALLLLSAFILLSVLLYVLYLRPALEEVALDKRTDPDTVDKIKTAPSDSRPKAMRRMLSLVGDVRDAATGQKINSATIKILKVDDIVDPQIQLDDEGLRIDYLPPGVTFGLAIAKPAYEALRIDEIRGEEKEILDLGTILLDPYRSISGRVFDSDGLPLAEVQIDAYRVPERSGVTSAFARAMMIDRAIAQKPTTTSRSDDGGRFSLKKLPAQQVILSASLAGKKIVTHPPIDLTRSNGRMSFAFDMNSWISGKLSFSNGTPVVNAQVTLVAIQGSANRTTVVADSMTDELGQFRCLARPGLEYHVFLRGEDMTSASFGPIILDRQTPLEFTALPASASDHRTAPGEPQDAMKTIGGEISSENSPLAGAVVSLPYSGSRTVTDRTGRYRINITPQTDAMLRVSAPGHATTEKTLGPETGETNQLNIALSRGGDLRVIARGPEDEPLSQTLIHLYEASGALITTEVTNSNATVQFDGLTLGAEYILVIAPRSLAPARSSAFVLEKHLEEGGIRLTAKEGADLHGVVLTTTGTPLTGAIATAFLSDPDRLDQLLMNHVTATTTTRTDGGFSFHNLPAGVFRVAVSYPNRITVTTGSIAIEDGSLTLGLVVALPPATPLSGRVITEDGSPISGATVRLLPRKHQIELTPRITDALGRFTFPRTDGEAATLVAEVGGHELGKVTAHRDTKTVDIEIHVP